MDRPDWSRVRWAPADAGGADGGVRRAAAAVRAGGAGRLQPTPASTCWATWWSGPRGSRSPRTCRPTLLEPLGLPQHRLGRRAQRRWRRDTARRRRVRCRSGSPNAGVVFAAGGLYSTVDDLFALEPGAARRARAVAAVLRADDRRPATRSATAARRARGVPQTYGYGLFVGAPGAAGDARASSDRQVFHTGSWAGFRAFSSLPAGDADVTVVVLSNRLRPGATRCCWRRSGRMAEALGRPLPIASRGEAAASLPRCSSERRDSGRAMTPQHPRLRPHRPLAARRLVVDHRPLAAGRRGGAGAARRDAVVRLQPGGGGADRAAATPSTSPCASACSPRRRR